MDRLGRDARRLGTELAALPPRVGLARARTRTGLSDAAFTRALNELVDRAVVTWDPAGHIVFTHDQLREAMAEQRPTRPGRRWLVAAILILALAVALLTIQSRGAPRYGGGTILLTAGDSVVALDPAGPVDRWEVGPSPVWYPAHPDIFGLPRARRLTNGRVVWFSSVLDLVEAPEGAVFWARDSTIVFEWPGDDGIKDVSPGGRYVLWATEDRSTPEYDMRLRAAPSTGRSPGRPLTRAASAVDGLWSPDGTRIAVISQRAQDSLWIMSPRGDRLLDRSAFSLRLEEWCGPNRLLALRRETPTSPADRIVIDVRGGSETSLRSPAIGGAACSPDGTAFISQELQEDGPALVLTELETGRRHTLPERTVVSGRILWIPDRVSPVPVALEVAADSVRLERGSGTRLQAAVRLTDGSLRGARVRWRSTDPDIASVLSDGTLLANRPGQVRLVAEFARWLTDTVAVRVEAGGGETLVLTDDFRELRPDRWDLLGFPTVRPARVDSQPVLELLGDGRYRDGLISHEARTFSTGVTAEMEFQLPLTRNEYQGIYFGLTTADPPPDSAYRANWMSWEDRRSVQASLPAYETDKWSPRLIGLRSSALSEAIAELPVTTDPGEWTHIAIQIRPDGLASLWVDRHKIAETQAPRSFLEEPLRVFIFGRTRDTYGYVRSFAWWSEPRYR